MKACQHLNILLNREFPWRRASHSQLTISSCFYRPPFLVSDICSFFSCATSTGMNIFRLLGMTSPFLETKRPSTYLLLDPILILELPCSRFGPSHLHLHTPPEDEILRRTLDHSHPQRNHLPANDPSVSFRHIIQIASPLLHRLRNPLPWCVFPHPNNPLSPPPSTPRNPSLTLIQTSSGPSSPTPTTPSSK